MRRPAPRPAAIAMREALRGAAPQTGLAAVQTVWPQAVGDAIAAVAEPVSERDGVVTVSCESATWAQELSLMEAELLGRLRELLGDQAPEGLRCSAG
jgi:predicted nucleic acid-binding Zn ribbon protein